MTPEDLQEIETQLQIILPDCYRAFLIARGHELAAATYEIGGETKSWFEELLYLRAEQVIDQNCVQRKRYSGTDFAFPNWWQTFFLVGSNGGGDYYCQKLDGSPQVWMIGSDCGNEPTLVHHSLSEYADACLSDYQRHLKTAAADSIVHSADSFDDEPLDAELVAAEPIDAELAEEPVQSAVDHALASMSPEEGRVWLTRDYEVDPDERPFLAQIIQQPDDDALRLALADWLEANGKPLRARFIRGQCALARSPHDPGQYVDALEDVIEGELGIKESSPGLTAGFEIPYHSEISEVWDRGFPTFATAEGSFDDNLQAELLPQLVTTTPVRGLKFLHTRGEECHRLLLSPAAPKIVYWTIENGPTVFSTLRNAPVARTIRSLNIVSHKLSDDELLELAATSFESLERLSIEGLWHCSGEAVSRLVSAPWFHRLHGLDIRLEDIKADAAEALAREIPQLQQLETFTLRVPPKAVMLAVASSSFPNLAKLCLAACDLDHDVVTALGNMRVPRLIDLSTYGILQASRITPAEFMRLTQTSLFEHLRVLNLAKVHDFNALEAVAKAPCAGKLRHLGVAWSRFESLAQTALARDGFPALTSLNLDHPFNPDDPYVGEEVEEKDTGRMLHSLHAARLKHLVLRDCGFDDTCAAALSENASFANLTRLKIHGGKLLTPAGAERMFRSSNLSQLLELELDSCTIGEAPLVLADASYMPGLVAARFRYCKVPENAKSQLASRTVIRW